MMTVGWITLLIFLVGVVLTILRKIPLPVQTVMVLITLINVLIGAAAHIFLPDGGGIGAAKLLPNQVMGGIILHPITALMAGLLISGALAASGGFDALKELFNRLFHTPLGLAGSLVLLSQLPLIVGLPCGRILAAALLPMLFSLGPEGLGVLGKTQLVVLTAAFARNSFGSCGPSPLGGIGAIGEGFLGEIGLLRAPQAFSLMIGTAVTALFVKIISDRFFGHEVGLKDTFTKKVDRVTVNLPKTGYISLIIFVITLLVALFNPFGPGYPVQTVLVVGTLLIMLAARLSVNDLLSGILLLPVTAMASGFLAAGSLAATGGFTALGEGLRFIATTPLGLAGMLVIFINIQTLLPLSCGRVLAAALVPVLYYFGPAGAHLLNSDQLAIVMAAYIINAATSCAPSPLGGGGMMAEGTVRAEEGYFRAALAFASIAIMSPAAAMFMNWVLLASGSSISVNSGLGVVILLMLLLCITFGLFKQVRRIGLKLNFSSRLVYSLLFISGGVLSGAILTCSIGLVSWLAICQGMLGGGVSGLLMALLLPQQNCLSRQGCNSGCQGC